MFDKIVLLACTAGVQIAIAQNLFDTVITEEDPYAHM